jgi:hypothetical protein
VRRMKATTAGPVAVMGASMPAPSFFARRVNKSNAAA